MSIAARVEYDVDVEHPVDPDQVTVPESIDHREFTETIAYFASLAVGPGVRICRNLAWYPTPSETALVPDCMVLPEQFVPDGTTSYQQAVVSGPVPSIVVEVVSDGNSFSDGLKKLRRYQLAGVPVVLIQVSERSVDRFDTTGTLMRWGAQPIPELGGIRIIDDPEQGLLVEGVDGQRARRLDAAARAHAISLVREAARAEAEAARADGEAARADGEAARADGEAARADGEAARAEAEAARAEAEAARAEAEAARAERLAEALKALGVDPSTI